MPPPDAGQQSDRGRSTLATSLEPTFRGAHQRPNDAMITSAAGLDNESTTIQLGSTQLHLTLYTDRNKVGLRGTIAAMLDNK